MGMSLNAYVCVGAIIQTDEFRENDNIISEEELEDEYEGYMTEYFYSILEPLGMSVNHTGYYEGYDGEIIVVLDNTSSSAYYGAGPVNVEVLTQENIDILDEKLTRAGIKYEAIGIFVYPTYG